MTLSLMECLMSNVLSHFCYFYLIVKTCVMEKTPASQFNLVEANISRVLTHLVIKNLNKTYINLSICYFQAANFHD